MKKILSLILLFIATLDCIAQEYAQDSIILTNPKLITAIEADWFDQIYLINSNQNIWKFDKNSKWLNHKSDLFIHNLNVDNPFNIYYIDTMDNLHFLNESLIELREPVQLFTIGIINSNTIAFQTNNRIWTIDIIRDELILYDLQLNQRILNADKIVSKPDEEWLNLKIANKQLVLTSNKRVLIFNTLGKLKQTINFDKEVNNIITQKDKVWFLSDSHLNYKNLSSSNSCVIDLHKPVEKFSISLSKIYALSDGVVYIYPLNNLESIPCISPSQETSVQVKLP